jgi:hypothetical protein
VNQLPGPLPQPPSDAVRDRAGVKLVLALLLVATVVGGAGGLIQIATGGGPEDTLDPSAGTRLPQRMLVLAICGLVNAGCAMGSWSFRRWGVYGVVCVSLFAFVLNWKMGGTAVALPGLIAVASLAAFAMALWVEFD